MPLPTNRTPPNIDATRLKVLVYGACKIGKSTFAAQSADALFLATEAGLGALDVYQNPIHNWDDMIAACAEIAAGKHPFKTVIVDTIDNLYRFCAEAICKKMRIDTLGDAEFGKGFAMCNSEFLRVLTKLSLLPYGLVLISHSQDVEVKTRTGKSMKTIPTLPGKARLIVLGLVDVILFVDQETTTVDGKPVSRRVVRTKGTDVYEAGDRTGKLPDTMDLDFPTFAAAFATAKPEEKKPAARAAKTETQKTLTAAQ